MSGETEEKPIKSQDVVLIHGKTDDGKGLRALRSREERLELAEIRPMEHGKSIQGAEVVSLSPRKESVLLWDVKVEYDGRGAAPSDHAGPARVSSELYRRNWEVIFEAGSGPTKEKSALN